MHKFILLALTNQYKYADLDTTVHDTRAVLEGEAKGLSNLIF